MRPLNVSKKEGQDWQGPCMGWKVPHIMEHAPDPVAPGRSGEVLQGAEVFLLGTGDFFLIAFALFFHQVRPSLTHRHSYIFLYG